MGMVLKDIRAIVNPQGGRAPAVLDSLCFAQQREARALGFLAASECQVLF